MPIRRADESKNYEAAIPQLNKLPELLKHWSATKEQSRTLYLLAYRIFSGAHRQCVPHPDIYFRVKCWLGQALFDFHALWRGDGGQNQQ